MALIEKQIVDLVELVKSNHIQVRTANIIEKDVLKLQEHFIDTYYHQVIVL